MLAHTPSDIPWKSIERVGHRDLLSKKIFAISWILGRFCNYHCSYCWPHGRSDKKDHRSTETILKALAEMKRQARERDFNSFHLSLSGGEPTFHPGFLEIVDRYVSDGANSNYQSLQITSNCSPGLGFFKKFLQSAKGVNDLSVSASFHSEFAQYEPFLEKMLYLKEQGVMVLINVVMKPSDFNKLLKFGHSFFEQGLHVSLKPQSNESASEIIKDYTPEQISLMSQDLTPPPEVEQLLVSDGNGSDFTLDHAERLNSLDFNRFTGWKCSAGFRSIIVREPCGSVKRGHSCGDQPLGNIETGFNLFNSVKNCITPTCVCSADSKIPKCQALSKLPLWPETTKSI